MKESSLLKVFDGQGILVDLQNGQQNTTDIPLDTFEIEVLRIFKEHKQLQVELETERAKALAISQAGGFPAWTGQEIINKDKKIIDLQAELDKAKQEAKKCPLANLDTDFCACKRTDELEKQLDKHQWIPASEPPKDSETVHICKDGWCLHGNYNPDTKGWEGSFVSDPAYWKPIILPVCKTCNGTGQVGDEIVSHGRSMGFKACPNCSD